MVWHDQWPPLTKRPKTHPTRWRGRCKPSPQRLNNSLNEKMSWNDGWSSRMIGSRMIKMMDGKGMNVTTTIPRRTITKRRMTKRKAMPSVDGTSRIPVVPLSWKSARYALRMTQEMQMMKEKIDMMMNALKGRVSTGLDKLVHRTDSPFNTSVTSFPLLAKFRMPQVKAYDGSKDPLDHLESFKTLMHLQGVSDEIMCRVFPTTLKGPALVWFSKIGPNFVSTFKELSGLFVTHFNGGQRHKRSSVSLLNIKQRDDESWGRMSLGLINRHYWLTKPTIKS